MQLCKYCVIISVKIFQNKEYDSIIIFIFAISYNPKQLNL